MTRKKVTDELKPKNLGGRPLIFKTPEDLAEQIEGYFEYAEKNNAKITLIGLSNYLGVDKELFSNYKDRPGYSAIIKKARQRCEQYLVDTTLDRQSFTPGQIFILKNHYGYADKQEVTHVNENKESNFDLSRITERQAKIYIALTKMCEGNAELTIEESNLLAEIDGMPPTIEV